MAVMSDVFYNKTVTIYNKSTSDDVMGADTWYPTVLSNVRVLFEHGKHKSLEGESVTNDVRLHISTVDLSPEYLKPIEWLTKEDKSGYFTLQQSSDFFVIGDTSSEDTSTSDFLEYMKSKYDDLFMIVSVGEFELIPHLEVIGA